MHLRKVEAALQSLLAYHPPTDQPKDDARRAFENEFIRLTSKFSLALQDHPVAIGILEDWTSQVADARKPGSPYDRALMAVREMLDEAVPWPVGPISQEALWVDFLPRYFPLLLSWMGYSSTCRIEDLGPPHGAHYLLGLILADRHGDPFEFFHPPDHPLFFDFINNQTFPKTDQTEGRRLDALRLEILKLTQLERTCHFPGSAMILSCSMMNAPQSTEDLDRLKLILFQVQSWGLNRLSAEVKEAAAALVASLTERSSSGESGPARDPPKRTRGERIDERMKETLTASPMEVAELQSPASEKAKNNHADDFSSVIWNGKRYTFTRTQAACVKILWEHYERGTPAVGQATVLLEAGATSKHLKDVFKKSQAWGEMIVPAARRGSYQLQEPKSET